MKRYFENTTHTFDQYGLYNGCVADLDIIINESIVGFRTPSRLKVEILVSSKLGFMVDIRTCLNNGILRGSDLIIRVDRR